MLFNSFEYLILVSITFVFYYLRHLKNTQVLILIISSIIFYGYNQPYLLILLILSATINSTSSFLTYKTKTHNKKKFYAFAGITSNLLILSSFKYSALITSLLVDDLTALDGIGHAFVMLPLPVGISFYTFQGISLLVDTFRHTKDNECPSFHIEDEFKNHYKKTFFYIIFFPQLVAGPIVKAHEFLPQIKTKFLKDLNIDFAFKSLVTGFFLKIVIADNLKDMTYWISYPQFENLSSLTLISLLFGYSIQIFADFAGYSLIAIGTASLFGYHLPQNFRFPYISKSFSEFWTRWHISLSTWLKEYLYFSLGGNRKGAFMTKINIMIVMLLGGLWHGAAWGYAIWGGMHGLALVAERLIAKLKLPQIKNNFMSFLQIIFVFSFVTTLWLFFVLSDLNEVGAYFTSIYNNLHKGHSLNTIATILIYSLPVILYHLNHLIEENYKKNITKNLDFILYGSMLFLLITNNGRPGAFIYFQF